MSVGAADYKSFEATITRVVDGDTVEATLYLGLGVSRIETIRLRCVNTPETHGEKAKTEKAAGLKAVAYVEKWVKAHPKVTLQLRKDNERDVYGRLLALVFPVDPAPDVTKERLVSLNEELLNANLGVLFMCDQKPN